MFIITIITYQGQMWDLLFHCITRVRDRIWIYSQISIYSKKVSRKVYMSDLQAVKIRLGYFLGMFHVWQLRIKCQNCYNGSQWGVYDFPMFEIGDFFGINTDLRIDPNSIPHTDYSGYFLRDDTRNTEELFI